MSSAETKLNIAQADYNKKKNECQGKILFRSPAQRGLISLFWVAVLEEQIRQVCNNERLPDMIADCEAEIQENKRYGPIARLHTSSTLSLF